MNHYRTASFRLRPIHPKTSMSPLTTITPTIKTLLSNPSQLLPKNGIFSRNNISALCSPHKHKKTKQHNKIIIPIFNQDTVREVTIIGENSKKVTYVIFPNVNQNCELSHDFDNISLCILATVNSNNILQFINTTISIVITSITSPKYYK